MGMKSGIACPPLEKVRGQFPHFPQQFHGLCSGGSNNTLHFLRTNTQTCLISMIINVWNAWQISKVESPKVKVVLITKNISGNHSINSYEQWHGVRWYMVANVGL